MPCAPRRPQGPRFRMWECSWQLQLKRWLRQSSLEVLKPLQVELPVLLARMICALAKGQTETVYAVV